jgi:hypothetical protein
LIAFGILICKNLANIMAIKRATTQPKQGLQTMAKKINNGLFDYIQLLASSQNERTFDEKSVLRHILPDFSLHGQKQLEGNCPRKITFIP